MAERGREWYHETSAGSPDTRRKCTVKKKNNQSLYELETVLANAGTGGAAGYHASRTAFRQTRMLAITLALVSVCAYRYGAHNHNVNASLAMSVILGSFVGAFLLSATLWAGFRRYRLVQHKVRLVRLALTRADAQPSVVSASGDWGHDLRDLGGILEKCAREAAESRSTVERSIKAHDQSLSAELKNLIEHLMQAGTTVELALRRKDGDFDRAWDSPFRWPGEDFNRRYAASSTVSERPRGTLPPRSIRLTARTA